MSKEDIIAMARDANPEHDLTAMLPFLSRFAALVAARERECVRCRRREPGKPDHQTHMEPPVFVGGKCPMRIEP